MLYRDIVEYLTSTGRTSRELLTTLPRLVGCYRQQSAARLYLRDPANAYNDASEYHDIALSRFGVNEPSRPLYELHCGDVTLRKPLPLVLQLPALQRGDGAAPGFGVEKMKERLLATFRDEVL